MIRLHDTRRPTLIRFECECSNFLNSSKMYGQGSKNGFSLTPIWDKRVKEVPNQIFTRCWIHSVQLCQYLHVHISVVLPGNFFQTQMKMKLLMTINSPWNILWLTQDSRKCVSISVPVILYFTLIFKFWFVWGNIESGSQCEMNSY